MRRILFSVKGVYKFYIQRPKTNFGVQRLIKLFIINLFWELFDMYINVKNATK